MEAYFIVPVLYHMVVPGGVSVGENKLEKAMQFGISTKDDFQAFKDNGGLNNSAQDSWQRFHVTAASALYNSAGKLSTMDLTVEQNLPDSKLASTNNLESALSSLCAGTWSSHDDAAFLETATMNCSLSASPSAGTVEVVVIAK